jgi:ElaB/YqjD/DUF883 family membrane-anchored ribosome-binding protein
MIYEPSATTKHLMSSPSSAGPHVEDERDQDQKIDDQLEEQLANLRGSFEERAAELGRRTAKMKAAFDITERIRDRPMAALAVGAAAGALTALIRPRIGSGLLAILMARAGREVITRGLEKVFHLLVDEHASGDARDGGGIKVSPSPSLHSRGTMHHEPL